jgi:hypothetical protein
MSSNILPLTSSVVAVFPDKPSARWRRAAAECRTYQDAVFLLYQIIHDIENSEKRRKPQQSAAGQLAFPWVRAAD